MTQGQHTDNADGQPRGAPDLDRPHPDYAWGLQDVEALRCPVELIDPAFLTRVYEGLRDGSGRAPVVPRSSMQLPTQISRRD